MKYRNSLRGLYTVGDYDDDPARLRGLTMPALIVTGAQTVSFHRAINESLLRMLPRAEALELGAGHNSPAADPDHFVSKWQRFEQRATRRVSVERDGSSSQMSSSWSLMKNAKRVPFGESRG